MFGNSGRRIITDLIFPPADALGVELYTAGGEVVLAGLTLYELNRTTDLERADE